jgi:glutathione S-transferase
MITLFWSPQTRAVRALWMLEEVGADYQVQAVDIRATPRNDPADFLAASPQGKVPALIDGEVKMADSAAMALYLADRYRPGELAPHADDPARGEFLYWLLYSPATIEPAMMEKFVKLDVESQSSPWGNFDDMVSVLEKRLDGRTWVAADRFTMADLMLAGSIQFMVQFDMLQPGPVLQDYMDRCLARGAAQRAQQRDGEETAGMEAASA